MRIKTYQNGRLVRDEIEGDVEAMTSASWCYVGITIAIGTLIMFALRIAAVVSHMNLC